MEDVISSRWRELEMNSRAWNSNLVLFYANLKDMQGYLEFQSINQRMCKCRLMTLDTYIGYIYVCKSGTA